MKIDSRWLGIMIFIVIFGSVAVSLIGGYWQTESTKAPAAFESGEFEGMPNPADIRGSYSFSDVSEAFGIPAEDLIEAFALPQGTDPEDFKNKDLELIYGELEQEGTEIGNGSVKLFAALYTGLPYEIDEVTYLPLEAVEILRENADLTEEQLLYIESNGIDVSRYRVEDNSSDEPQEPVDEEGEKESDERLITGKTTFAELIAWGIPLETIENVLGSGITDQSSSIRDFCTQEEIEFSLVKGKLQEEADSLD